MRVKAIRDCFVGSYRKTDEEFDYSGAENRNLRPLGGAKWPKQASATQVTKPGADVDYGKAALFLQSRGYKVDTPESAQKFVDGLGKKDRASFLAELTVFEPASSRDEGDAANRDANVSATTVVGESDGEGPDLATGDAERKSVDGETAK